jgi:hypothetical protein
MNIFILSEDTRENARWHCDKHITKMPLEAAQLLSTAIICCGGTTRYKLAHKNHPCAIWARTTRSNFLYLAQLAYDLCDEYKARYNKEHGCLPVIDECLSLSSLVPDGPQTDFVQAMPEEYKRSTAVEAYRAYYLGAKADIAKWKHSPRPFWWSKEVA